MASSLLVCVVRRELDRRPDPAFECGARLAGSRACSEFLARRTAARVAEGGQSGRLNGL